MSHRYSNRRKIEPPQLPIYGKTGVAQSVCPCPPNPVVRADPSPLSYVAQEDQQTHHANGIHLEEQFQKRRGENKQTESAVGMGLITVHDSRLLTSDGTHHYQANESSRSRSRYRSSERRDQRTTPHKLLSPTTRSSRFRSDTSASDHCDVNSNKHSSSPNKSNHRSASQTKSLAASRSRSPLRRAKPSASSSKHSTRLSSRLGTKAGHLTHSDTESGSCKGSSKSRARNPAVDGEGWHPRYGMNPFTAKETDEEVLMRRQKCLDVFKCKKVYDRYLELVPKEKREIRDPWTPDKFELSSRRGWDNGVKTWKLRIYRLMEKLEPGVTYEDSSGANPTA